jgi:hypothetical protein
VTGGGRWAGGTPQQQHLRIVQEAQQAGEQQRKEAEFRAASAGFGDELCALKARQAEKRESSEAPSQHAAASSPSSSERQDEHQDEAQGDGGEACPGGNWRAEGERDPSPPPATSGVGRGQLDLQDPLEVDQLAANEQHRRAVREEELATQGLCWALEYAPTLAAAYL